ncbi:MAG: cation-translocating P-type ATPase [Acidimicrobiia bacterium]|nr:cation-translocating P-type ATPase [Acidimicrobiia bacterium]
MNQQANERTNHASGEAQIGSAPFHVLSAGESIPLLDTSPRGLAAAEATQRLSTIGPNELEASESASPWALLVAQFKNVLIIILLIAVGLSVALGEGIEAVVIGVIVVFAVLLGFIQEYRAERAIEALREMAAPSARVLRDGEEHVVPARELVPGDIVLLQVGDRIPADLRLIEAHNLQTDEAPLTGESVPVEKCVPPIEDHEVAIADRRNMAYSGTIVTYGRGVGAVTATGMQTEFGKIAGMLQTVEVGKTPLQENLDRVGKVLAVIALVVVAIIVVLGVLRGQDLLEMLLFGIALAVAVVPEALPAVVTISLAMGVRRIVKRKALIRRLPAVETLGSTSVICSDKTGTLTRNEMTVRRIVAAGVSADISGTGYDPEGDVLVDGVVVSAPPAIVDLLRTATLASDATLAHDVDGRRIIRGDPTEGALVVAAAKLGMDKHELDTRFPRTEELPFSSERKRMTTLHDDGSSTFACSKGAAEVILDACTTVSSRDSDIPLDEPIRRDLLGHAESLAGDGIRVLGVARKPDAVLATAEAGMTFLGLVGLVDPPRPEAATSVAACRDAGIEVVMITGDHPVTAAAIAREVGVLDEGRVVTGRELEQMTDDELAAEVADIVVYARVSPADKLRIVSAWQGRGAVVAMTGDGVNDAPALKKSDIGVAMAIAGTDVSREASEMVLLDDNFASIVAAVEEGRGIFGNIKKYLMYLISANVGETLLIATATVAGMPLPLSAVQILYVNLATDGLPALALSVDPAEPDLMHRPPRDPRRGVFTKPVVTLMSLGGLWSAIVNFGVFVTTRATGGSDEQAMANTFVCLVLIEFFKAYNFRSDRRSVFDRPFANRWLNLAILWEVLLLGAIMYVPLLQEAFGTYALSPAQWLVLVCVAASIIPVLETAKWMERRGWFGEMD